MRDIGHKLKPTQAAQVMIGGPPYLMPYLVHSLLERHLEAVFAFSKRESAETVQGDKVIKTSVFKHVGFVHL